MTLMLLTVLCLAASLAMLVHLMWLGGQGRDTIAPLNNDEMRRHLLWHMFYVNPADPRGWVPKIWGIGWTVNFRERRHVMVFSTLLLVTLGSAIALSALALMGIG